MKSDAISEETFDTKLITNGSYYASFAPHALELLGLQPVLKPLAKLEYVIIFFINCSDS